MIQLLPEGLSATLIYVDGTKGWQLINDDATAQIGAAFIAATGGTVLTNGNFKTHVSTSSSNFVVSAVEMQQVQTQLNIWL